MWYKISGYQEAEWANGNALKFLNLYQDDLPSVQYLFVTLTIVDGVLNAEFNVRNTGNIDPVLFERIETTYTKMCLCRRFKERCYEELSELALTVLNYLSLGMTDVQIKSAIKSEVERLRIRKGYNYRKAILKRSLLRRLIRVRLPQNDAIVHQIRSSNL